MTRWAEDEWVTISALEHFSYCPRQCALIYLEQTFDENIYTLRGRAVHRRADTKESRSERGVRAERGLPLWSARLGLTGRADIVEFGPTGPVPVEYKAGAGGASEHAEIQLCAQALCLEEMFACTVARGMIFSAQSRRRRDVDLTPELRAKTEAVVAAVRLMLTQSVVPPPVHDERCTTCSLITSCLPGVVGDQTRLRELAAGLMTPET